MKNNFTLIAFLVIATIIGACSKEANATVECFAGTTTIRQIINQPATIKLSGGQFYIIEQGAIDTKLNPCNLTQPFQVNDLQVTISGDIKSTIAGGAGPCCTENFVITKITK